MGKYLIRTASAPDNCKCKKDCQTKRCSCFKANLKYTELCKCTNTLLAMLLAWHNFIQKSTQLSNCENSEITEIDLIDNNFIDEGSGL